MLARRFKIVCLITTLFGMFFAILVAEASRSTRTWDTGLVVPCAFPDGLGCSPSRHR